MSRNEEIFNSKHTLVLGAFLLFVSAFGIGIFAGNEVSLSLRNATIAAVVGLMLAKVLLFFLVTNIRAARIYRENLQAKKDAEDSSKK